MLVSPTVYIYMCVYVCEPIQVEYAPPIYDVNAPDLYLPLMSLITYVLSVGLLEGTKLRCAPSSTL